jgi:hypothetical protein
MALEDGGTQPGRFTDARGRTFDFYIDHRIGTTTPGAIYLNAPAEAEKCPGYRPNRVQTETGF